MQPNRREHVRHFVAVAAGYEHSLGLKDDGSIVAWGLNNDGQCDVPAPNAGFVDIAGGWVHSLGLKADNSIVAWGRTIEGQCNVPSPNADFVALAGPFHGVVAGEDDLTAGAARPGRQTAGERLGPLLRGRVDQRVQQLVQLGRGNPCDGNRLVDQVTPAFDFAEAGADPPAD